VSRRRYHRVDRKGIAISCCNQRINGLLIKRLPRYWRATPGCDKVCRGPYDEHIDLLRHHESVGFNLFCDFKQLRLLRILCAGIATEIALNS